MDIYEQIRRFDELSDFITNRLPVFAEQVAAADLVALVTNRVVQKGEDFQGKAFSPYSTTTIAAWRFWGKSRTQAAERKVRKKSRAKELLSYEEFRRLNNLRTNKKNFEFTGEMWRKFGVVSTQTSANLIRVVMAGKSTAAQNKMDENSDREGVNIIEASAKEEKIIQDTTSAWLLRNAEEILVI